MEINSNLAEKEVYWAKEEARIVECVRECCELVRNVLAQVRCKKLDAFLGNFTKNHW